MVRFGVWDPHGNPGHRPKNRYFATVRDRNCFQSSHRQRRTGEKIIIIIIRCHCGSSRCWAAGAKVESHRGSELCQSGYVCCFFFECFRVFGYSMTWQQGSGGWQWQQSGSSFSNGGAPQVQQYTAKEVEAWGSGTWSEWTCTNCRTVGWSVQKKCRNCGVKKSCASSLLDGHHRNQTARHRSLGNYNKWRHNYNLYVEKIKHKQEAWTCLLSNLLGRERSYGKSSRWRAFSSLDMEAPELEAATKLLEQQLTELKTQQKGTTTVEQKIGKREGSSAESSKESRGSESRVHSGPDCQRAGGPGSSENTIGTQEAHKAATDATGARPLDRCSDIIDNTSTALHKAGAPAEHLEQARQAAFTLITGLQGLCTAAGVVTVADEPEDLMMDFDGSDEEFRQMLSRASQDEEIARSVRRRLTDKRSQSRERTLNSHKTWRPSAHSTHNAVRVTHTERLVLSTVNVKSLKPKDLSRSHKYGVDSTIDQIDRYMSLHGCHVVGVRESCIKGNVTREQQNFVAYTSGTNGKGQFGVVMARTLTCCDPWLSSSMRMDEWEHPRAGSLGAVPATWKTRMGASYEGYSKRGTCTQCRHSPPHLPANLVEWAGATPRQTHRLCGCQW